MYYRSGMTISTYVHTDALLSWFIVSKKYLTSTLYLEKLFLIYYIIIL